MNFLLQPVEDWLWPSGGSRESPVPRAMLLGRYAYALARDLLHGDLGLRAVSLVYTTMLATVPLLAFAFSLLKGLGVHRQLEPFLRNLLAPLGPRSDELTQRIIGFVDNVNGGTLASLSILLLLYTALSMAQQVESSLNFVWRVDRPRSLARRFSEYLSVMLVGPLFMSAAMGLIGTLASSALVERLRAAEPFGAWLAGVGNLLPYTLLIGGFSFLYVFVPNTRVRVAPALVGGLFAGVLWVAGGKLFATFVVSASRTEAIYSGFAIVLVAMFWLQISWLILLLGSQLAYYVQNPAELRHGQRRVGLASSLRERLALATMLLVGRDFEQPGHGWRAESLAARLRVPSHALDPVIVALKSAGLLATTAEERLIPARDPHRIELAAILAAVREPPASAQADTHDWTPTIETVAADIDTAIRSALASRTLADLVADDGASSPTPNS
jgi:membrane protein